MRPGDLPCEGPYLSPDVRHRDNFPMRAARHGAYDKQARLRRSAACYSVALPVYIYTDGQLVGPDQPLCKQISQQRVGCPPQVSKRTCTVNYSRNCEPLGPVLSAIAYIYRDRTVFERSRPHLGGADVQPSLCLHRLKP